MHPPPGLATITAAIDHVSSVASGLDTTSTSIPAPTSTALPGSHNENPGECSLLGSFAILVQAALGALALLSLVYKRWRERPQRPLKIWFFDVSKQVVGSVMVHMANIFMSMLTSGRFSVQVSTRAIRSDDGYAPNPCSSYLLNLAIDTTLGIPILIILLRVLTGLARFTPLGQPPESVQSGYYGHPPNAVWWLKQSAIYFGGLFGMKICVLIIFIMMPWISKIGDWALGWTEGNEKLQIAFVMMIFPLIMNAMQYYIIDSFIKRKELDHECVPTEDPDTGRYDDSEDETSRVRLVDAETDTESDEEATKHTAKHASQPKNKDTEYDPDVDGDERTILGSSSSSGNTGNKSVPPELYPKE